MLVAMSVGPPSGSNLDACHLGCLPTHPAGAQPGPCTLCLWLSQGTPVGEGTYAAVPHAERSKGPGGKEGP